MEYPYPDKLKNDQILETLEAFEEIKAEGLIRSYGISNETPWGMMRYQELSRTNNFTGISTIQNPYNLLNRTFEIGMSEVCHREGVQLLPYSPLGFGVLTGKYINNTSSPKDRLNRWRDYKRYSNEHAIKSTEMYLALAQKLGVSLTQLALEFVTSRPFVVSNIIGATSIEQLKENIESTNLQITEEILRRSIAFTSSTQIPVLKG